MPPSPTLRLGCLVSGGGRSVMNLQDRIERRSLPASIAVVIATRAGVAAIERARARGIQTHQIDPLPRETLDDRVDQALRQADVDLVVLAGYLRLFRVDAWRGRCINIHPALLPRHGGKGLWGHHVHEAVLAAGDPESGCTVHWVDAEYDHGATILQRRCPVLPGDSPDTLAARVFAEEIEALPEAIRRISVGDASPAATTG